MITVHYESCGSLASIGTLFHYGSLPTRGTLHQLGSLSAYGTLQWQGSLRNCRYSCQSRLTYFLWNSRVLMVHLLSRYSVTSGSLHLYGALHCYGSPTYCGTLAYVVNITSSALYFESVRFQKWYSSGCRLTITGWHTYVEWFTFVAWLSSVARFTKERWHST